ncbi:MAG: urea transporter [Bdellovibrionales bacterium]|nr:urea transporter [Bdellovibrionales bacterium]
MRIQTFARGLGQIMLQESSITGMLFLTGIAVNSLVLAAGAVLGNLVGTLSGRLSACDRDEIAKGLYGFNGALVGIALLSFFAPSALVVGCIIVAAASSSLVMKLMLRATQLPPLTAPFVVCTWLALLVGDAFSLPSPNALPSTLASNDIAAIARGAGQVMFQESAISGALFLAGIAAHSRQSAAWCILTSAFGLVFGRGIGLSDAMGASGLLGYNACLAGIALQGTAWGAFAPLLGACFAVLITCAFHVTGLPALTAPFVVASWIVLIAVPEKEGSEGTSTESIGSRSDGNRVPKHRS